MKQGTLEWLLWRKQGIGASDAPIIMGDSPYKTIQELWEEKIDPVTELDIGKKDFLYSSNKYMADMGHKFEPQARAIAEFQLDMDLPPANMESQSNSVFRASFDGLNIERESILEIKMVGADVYKEFVETSMPPAKYYAQLQHQFMVTGFKEMFLLCYTLSPCKTYIKDKQIKKIERNDDYIKNTLQPRLLWFWDCVQKRKNPIDIDQSLGDEYIKLDTEIKELKIKLDDIKTKIIGASTEKKYSVGKVQITRFTKKGSIQYNKIPEIQSLDLDQYRSPDTEQIKVTIKK